MTDAASISINIHKRFATGFELQAEFAAPPGITILFGASGSGKTTLLNCVAGLFRPDAGHVNVGGHVVFDSTQGIDLDVSQRHIGYVFQNLALFPHLSIEENVAYGIRHLARDERKERVYTILRSFRIEHLANRRPGDVSGGERQRVALARSLVTGPRAMLLDEPLTALDLPTQSLIIDDLRVWTDQRRIPILYVTHSQREIHALGERVFVLECGHMISEGIPREVLEVPKVESVAQLAGIENIFDATVASVHEDLGTMSCVLAGTKVELEVPLGRYERGSRVRIGIRAGDILMATVPPEHLSARNVIRGTITSLVQEGVAVGVKVDCEVSFFAKLTPASVRSLELAPGKPVWLVIKTYSCQLLRPTASDGGASV
jgi:molybdate transport system ATP-binding protein